MDGAARVKREEAAYEYTIPTIPSQIKMPEGKPWKDEDAFEANTIPWKNNSETKTVPASKIYEFDHVIRPERPFPKADRDSKFTLPQETDAALARVRKGKAARDPDSNVKICSSNYTAMEIHGFYGVIDDGSAGNGHALILHVPKWVRGYQLDIRDGDDLPVAHIAGKAGGTLRVLETGRHKYYSPGKKVTTCTVVVPEEQWARFKS